MLKKTLLIFVLLTFLFAVSACDSEYENSDKQGTNNYSYTARETKIYNYFKDRIPEFDFKNEPVEKYDEGISYVLTVRCSEKEYKKYIKKLKKSGFELNSYEAETYYSATDSDGYFAEVTYIEDMLTVYVKKA